MRANRKMRELNNDRAEVGIGTMIVFIATVLVAAIAAGVLLDTSGKLQERSSKTGNAATEKVSSSIRVDSIQGRRDTTASATLDDLDFYVSLAPGAQPVDLTALKITMISESYHKWINHSAAWPAAGLNFNASDVRDADATLANYGRFVMNEGDAARLTVSCATPDAACNLFALRDHVTVVFQPEVGVETLTGFTMPASFGSETRHKLV